MNTFCRYYNQGICLSCQLLETPYPEQVALKEKKLIEALAGLDVPALLPTVHARQTGFRNKAKISVTGSKERPVLGLIGETNLDSGRELLECPVHHPVLNELLFILRDFITLASLIPYNISEKKGELKGVILFHAEDTNESYLRFVMRSKESLDRIKKHLPDLLSKVSHSLSVSVNLQPVPHAILEGKQEVFLTEKKGVSLSLPSAKLSVDPRGFVQTNQEIAKRLYGTAADWIKDTGARSVCELFCGHGAFSFAFAPVIEKGLGIELNPEAVEAATETAKKNGFDHLKFKAADASAVKEDVSAFAPDLLLVNPPRRGLGEALELIRTLHVDRLIYSSCNFLTLAQDLRALKNYTFRKIQIFDMFPHTEHFETLVLLERINSGD